MTDGAGIPVLVVFGPTASGKTSLAEVLFAAGVHPLIEGIDGRYRGMAEIVSADSMQVYRRMDIGTAKPDAAFLQSLPHHLLDICDPRQQFCAGDFVRLADIACKDVHSRGKLPVLLGGTAFYIKNFLYGLPETPQSDPAIRSHFLDRMENEGADILMKELESVDPESAHRIHIHDEYRIVRALEVFHSSGRPLGSFALSGTYRSGYRFLVLALERPRDELYDRINRRVDAMFAAGLSEEFHTLVEAGYTKDDPGMQAIGYREFFLTEPPGSDLEAISAQIKLDSRKYAKRQETFIRAMPGVIGVPADDFVSIFSKITAFTDPLNTERAT